MEGTVEHRNVLCRYQLCQVLDKESILEVLEFV